MNLNQLKAFIKNSEWQMMAIESELSQLRTEKEALTQQRAWIDQTIKDAARLSDRIHPEQEMTRLAFINQKYEQQESLYLQIKSLHQHIEQLSQKLIEAKTKHKMLCHLMERLGQEQTLQQQLNQEKCLEDLILMRDYS